MRREVSGTGKAGGGVVTAVLCAAFDPDGDERLRRLRAALAAASPRLARPPLHRPHITLGATRTPLEGLPAIHRLAGALAAGRRPFALPLDHVGVFPDGVLWLAPAPSVALVELQRDVDAALDDAGHERAFATAAPQRWVPHCTLGTGLKPAELGAAVELLARRWRPVRARVELLVTLLVGRRDEHENRLGQPV